MALGPVVSRRAGLSGVDHSADSPGSPLGNLPPYTLQNPYSASDPYGVNAGPSLAEQHGYDPSNLATGGQPPGTYWDTATQSFRLSSNPWKRWYPVSQTFEEDGVEQVAPPLTQTDINDQAVFIIESDGPDGSLTFAAAQGSTVMVDGNPATVSVTQPFARKLIDDASSGFPPSSGATFTPPPPPLTRGGMYYMDGKFIDDDGNDAPPTPGSTTVPLPESSGGTLPVPAAEGGGESQFSDDVPGSAPVQSAGFGMIAALGILGALLVGKGKRS